MRMTKQLLSGHEVSQASTEEEKKTEMIPFIHGLVRILPEGWLYPGTSPAYLDKIQSAKFRCDDVFVTTFPKCGTTWMQEIVWTMLHNPNLDNPEADEPVMLRSPDISFDMIFDSEALHGSPMESFGKRFEELYPNKGKEDGIMLDIIEATKSPRVIKNHFALPLLPQNLLDKVKMVYVARNPKDMTLSFWKFMKAVNVHEFQGSLENFARLIMNDGMLYCPYWAHVKAAWEMRHHPNLHFVFYEDLKTDIKKELEKLDKFLGTQLSEETLEAVSRYTSFPAMKSRGEPLSDKVFDKDEPERVVFFRKGITGDWKNYFTPELQREMDNWIEENLAGNDLSLRWALM